MLRDKSARVDERESTQFAGICCRKGVTMPAETERETCTATARSGERCTAWPVRGQEQCAGHLGLGKLDPVAANQRSAEVRRQRKEDRIARREMSFGDHVAAAIERHADAIVQAYLTAGLKQGDWRALDSLVTRHLGKPVERVEVETEGVDLRSLSDVELQALKRRLMQQRSA